MAYTIKGPTGKPNALECEPVLTEEENGMVFIDVTIEPSENNKKFIKNVTEHWTIAGVKTAQYGDFHIQNLEKVGVGEWPTLKIKAVADFIFKLQTTTFDGYFTGSRTAVSFFAELSRQSGLTFEPIDFKDAFGWEKFGLGVHTMDEFNRGLNNYGYTYYPVTPQIIHLRDQIGRDTNYMIKNAMNSSEMKVEIDRSAVFTYAEGYADYSEDEGNENFYENAALWDEYKHPTLYNLLGKLSAPVYTNQKINNKETLNAYLKKIVDESIKFTITTDFHRIPDYPFAVPMLGDRIRVQDDAIDIDETAKAVKIKTYFDSYGEPLDYEIDFGNLRVSQREQSRLDSTQQQIEDLLSGRTPVGTGMVDSYIKSVIQGFKSAETEVRFNGYNGMNGLFLVDPTDENDAVGLFSKGIAVTQNAFQGGAQDNLAIVPGGIVADWIRVGTLWLDRFLGIIGKDSWLQLTAEEFLMKSLTDENQFFRATPGEVTISNGILKIIGGLKDSEIENADKWNGQGTFIDSEGIYTGNLTANQINAGTLFLERFLGIVGKNSKLKITDELIRVEDVSDPSKYLEMNINDGFTLSKLPFTQIAPDGRVIFDDGYQRGSVLANVIQFNSDATVQFNGMNWKYSSSSTIRTYYMNDQYKGRFLDIITAIGVTQASPAGSARVDIQVVTTGGEIVAATNIFVSRTSGEMDAHRIRCDLQALFGTVPDFRRIGLYIQTRTTANVSAELEFRVNGGEFYA